MEKLKQKVAILQESIETSKIQIIKSESEVTIKEENIEELISTTEGLNLQIQTSENDLETAEEELSSDKEKRKRMTDDEEEIDRSLRKLKHSTNQSRAGASGLQEKIMNNSEKLTLLQSEIEEKERSIDIFEQDLDMAEQQNSVLKEELSKLETESDEATNVLQSIASSHVSASGAGGNLRNLVAKRINDLENKKKQHDLLSSIVEDLIEKRDLIHLEFEAAADRLEKEKNECTKILEDLEL